MRVVCHGCGARYQIADERVHGKLVRLRCRQCAAVLEARGPRREAPPAPMPPPLPPRPWFVAQGEGYLGPMTTQELLARVRRRELGPDDLVWRDGLEAWQPIAALDELGEALAGPAEPLPDSPPAKRPPPLRVLHFPAAAGAAAPALAAGPAPAPRPLVAQLPAPAPAPLAVARWPLWLAFLGGVAVTVAAGTVVLLRPRPTVLEVGAPVHQPVRSARPASAPASAPTANARDARAAVAPLEILGARRSAGRVAAPVAPDAGRTALALYLGTSDDDAKTALAARIYRRNRSTLFACDALAERRGETVQRGARAAFTVHVTAGGTAVVEVRGRGLTDERLACYRMVAVQWPFPSIGVDYSTTFSHVH